MDSLDRIDQEVANCADCALHQNRSRAVPGEGPADAQIMFIGEAPGFNEDKQGRPFVGAAGQFLDSLLASINLRREDVYITNTVKCRPLNNRDPLPGEMAACRKYLDRQIALIAPKVIVTLGRHSLTAFLPKETISRARGKPRSVQGATLFPMYHPAAALHQQSLRSVIEADIQKLPDLLKESPPPEAEEEREGEQLSMF